MMARAGLILGLVVLVAGRVASAQDIPRPEHPRPDLERSEWLNLNGPWDFAETDDGDTAPFLAPDAPFKEQITVPFCREAPLSGIGRREFVKNVWYRRNFTVPSGWNSPRIRLHIGACDWLTTVWVNGRQFPTHEGGNSPIALDITGALHRDGENTIIVHAYDDTPSGLQPLGKQSIRGESYAIFYTPTTGIWQTVWLEGVGASFVSGLRVEPDLAGSRAQLAIGLDGPTEGLEISATATADGQTVAQAQRVAQWRDNILDLPIDQPRLWSPDDPFLYTLNVKLMKGGEVVDELNSYFGMREVTIDGAAILINGKAIFQRLVLDQGFYPEGVWTAPSDAALKGDIEMSMAAGFNGARLHQKVFEPRFLYWADKLGYLVWGEYPSYGADYRKAEVQRPIIDEWRAIVTRDRNHPAIIGWCPFNETPVEAGPLQQTVVRLTRELDPARPVIETSGWTHTLPDPEVMDAHDYDQNPNSFRARWNDSFLMERSVRLPERYGFDNTGSLPFLISEYGGIGWSLDKNAWGYGNTPETLEAFYERFAGLTDALLDNRYLSGLCYTQLTNVEQEQNGIYAFNREPKFDTAKLHAILSRKAAYEEAPPTGGAALRDVDWRIALGSWHDRPNQPVWRYTTEAPAAAWAEAGFDDSAWKKGKAPFGEKGPDWAAKIQTPWTGKHLWLRTTFTGGQATDLVALVLHHDDDIEIFLNGNPVFHRQGWNDSYGAFDVTESVAPALKTGENILAVQMQQGTGGQYFDLALLLGTVSE